MALVLTRLRGQSVVVNLPDGRLVTLKLSRIGESRAELVIDAPDDVVVHRAEVQQSIEREGRR
jgi:sRNA-binding carbon storage regulator CsrA